MSDVEFMKNSKSEIKKPKYGLPISDSLLNVYNYYKLTRMYDLQQNMIAIKTINYRIGP